MLSRRRQVRLQSKYSSMFNQQYIVSECDVNLVFGYHVDDASTHTPQAVKKTHSQPSKTVASMLGL